MKTNKPLEATAGNSFFDSLAKFVHYGLYVMVLVVNTVGLIFSLQTGRFQSVFMGTEIQFGLPNGFPAIEGTPAPGQFPPPGGGAGGFPEGAPLPGFQGGPGGPGGAFSLLMIHKLAAYALSVLVALHILEALYHQVLLKDNLIARMWYGQVQ